MFSTFLPFQRIVKDCLQCIRLINSLLASQVSPWVRMAGLPADAYSMLLEKCVAPCHVGTGSAAI